MNSEIVDRLDKSFAKDEKNQLTQKIVMDNVYEQFGGKDIYFLMNLLADALHIIEGETGKSWRYDSKTYVQVLAVYGAILCRYMPEQHRPTKPAIDPLPLVEDVAGVLVGGLKGRRTRNLLDEGGHPEA